jgi:serine O-acetyltransferase
MWPRLTRDFRRLQEIKGWGTLRTLADALIFDSGFQALILYRTAHTLRRWGVPFLPPLCRRLSIALCGIDILPQAEIGGGCYIPHGVGLVVGGATIIGDDCTLLQGVTFGEARFDTDDCPRVGDRVTIGAGAKLLGHIKVGDGASIGAGAVVLEDVPAGYVAVGVPAQARPGEPT